MHAKLTTWPLLLTALGACAPAREVEHSGSATEPLSATTPGSAICDPDGPEPEFVLSPGGTLELGPGAVHSSACRVRVVDVRELDELGSELGVIAQAKHVARRRLAVEALDWDRDEPIVLVCRSGRRSGEAARELRELGFSRVASMTGGMLAWTAAGLPVVDSASIVAPAPAPSPGLARSVSRADVQAHVANRDYVRWTKAATLMLHGTQACVDGRDAHAIIGTPGGDAGELVLALASAERVRGQPFSDAELEAIFDAYLDAFGHFYMHSDDHAVAALLADLDLEQADASAAAAFLASPPAAVESRLLDALADPAHIGCGHLRLMVQHSDEYGVRPQLVATVMRAFFRRLWEHHPALDFVVLQGEHAESAVVTIELAHEVRGYTRIPLVSPRIADTEVFVVHPQVARFIRSENVSFLLERGALGEGVSEASVMAELEPLADRQLAATVAYLAADLPFYRVSFDAAGESFAVVSE